MNRYFARLYSQTMFSWGSRKDHANKIQRSGHFHLPSQEMFAYELTVPISNGVAFTGIGFDGFIDANDHDEALTLMYNSVNLILCLNSYVTLSPYNSVRVICDYEATPAQPERKFNHYSYPSLIPEILKSIRIVDMDLFKAVWNEGDHSIYTPSLNNALFQLNKSLQAEVLTDEFLSLWNGIEYLAKTINTKYNIQETLKYIKCRDCGTAILKCSKCNHEFKDQVKSKGRFDGIKLIATNKQGLQKKEFDLLHEARSVLLHDGTFKPEWKDLIPKARNLLLWVIAEAIGIEDNVVQKILSLNPSRANIDAMGSKLIHRGILTGLDQIPNIDSIYTQPNLKYKDENSFPILSMNEKGVINARRDMNFEYIAPEGVVFNDIISEVWVSKVSGIKNSSLDLKKNSNIKDE